MVGGKRFEHISSSEIVDYFNISLDVIVNKFRDGVGRWALLELLEL